MSNESQELEGVLEFNLNTFPDDRGFFQGSYKAKSARGENRDNHFHKAS
jgi:dTDP-4-dehydrorhamnose 3,5-epimerase-like enzyme